MIIYASFAINIIIFIILATAIAIFNNISWQAQVASKREVNRMKKVLDYIRENHPEKFPADTVIVKGT